MKLHLQQELAYEVISASVLVILFGLAYLFATNLLSVNFFSIIFALLFLLGIYLKLSCHIIISEDQLTICYYKYLESMNVDMKQIDELIFHQKERQIEIKDNNGHATPIFMNMKNKEKLLNYLVQYYPEIDCIFI